MKKDNSNMIMLCQSRIINERNTDGVLNKYKNLLIEGPKWWF